jgi:hypothetical protein
MDRRHFLAAVVATPALVAFLAACGDDDALEGNPNDLPADTTLPAEGGVTVPAQGSYSYATGANDVVMRIGYEGGFVAQSTIFLHTPNLLISGDGRAIQPGVTTAVYPGQLLPALMERRIDPDGIQAVLRAAAGADLLGPAPDYTMAGGMTIADAADTVVTVTVDGTTYTHRAYALDIPLPAGQSDTAARKNLAAFVAAMSNLDQVAGAEHLTDSTTLAAAQYRFQAAAVDPTQWSDPAPTLQLWPASTGVVLASSATCAIADAAAVGDLFASANQLTFFTEADAAGTEVVYQVAAIAVLPGDEPC